MNRFNEGDNICSFALCPFHQFTVIFFLSCPNNFLPKPYSPKPINNKPLKSLALKDSCRITGWRAGFPNKSSCR